jgi:hypothetical protein
LKIVFKHNVTVEVKWPRAPKKNAYISKKFDGSSPGDYNCLEYARVGPITRARYIRAGPGRPDRQTGSLGSRRASRGPDSFERSGTIHTTPNRIPAITSLREARDPDEVARRKEFYRRSLELFLIMIEKEPVNVPAWGHCGLLLYELGRFDESLDYFRMIIDHEPENGVAWDASGFIRMERGDFAGAADAFGRVLTLFPKRADVAADLALCLFHAGRHAEAAEVLTGRVGKLMGTREHYLMGVIEREAGRDPDPHFERALETYRRPEGPVREGIFATQAAMRGVIYTRMGKSGEARDVLIEAGDRASLTDPDRMILSAVDLTFKVRGAFIREVRGLLQKIVD